jgi:hypothetical protein
VRSVTANHEDWIGEAKGRKAEKSDNDEEDFPQTKRMNANENHTRYGFYEQRPCHTSAATPQGSSTSQPAHRLGTAPLPLLYLLMKERAKLRPCFASTKFGWSRRAAS